MDRAARNIACVLHLGDITNHNTPEQWENAVRSMRILDGYVPYFMVPGNHDYKGSGIDRTTQINSYFPVVSFRDRPTFGGTYDKEPDRIENSYHRFTVEGRKFLVIALEFGPRCDVVRWANDVVRRHSDHEAILITHAYMYHDDTRYDWEKYGKDQHYNPHDYGIAKVTGDDVMDGEELWTNLVSRHENFIMTLNGHVTGGWSWAAGLSDSGRTRRLSNARQLPDASKWRRWLAAVDGIPSGRENGADLRLLPNTQPAQRIASESVHPNAVLKDRCQSSLTP